MNPRKARIKDIAKAAGVSIGTVDRVLHNRGEVAEQTKSKVMQIAKDLDYSPNLIAQTLKLKRKFKLVSLLPEPSEDQTYWIKHPLGMIKAMDELTPFPVTLQQINFNILDEIDFRKKAIDVLKSEPDAVVLAPIFKNESTDFCIQLKNKKIPFVFVDGFIEEADFLSYTGEDVFQSGRVAGQLTEMVTPFNKCILIVNIARNLENVHHLNNRTLGFMSYFPDSGKKMRRMINLNISDSANDSIKIEMDKALNENNNIGSVFITGSKSFKIADYLISVGIDNLNIIGYDLLDKNVEFLKSGQIKFLISQRPEEQAYKGIRKLFEFLAMNKIPEKLEYLPVDIVTSENVKFFI